MNATKDLHTLKHVAWNCTHPKFWGNKLLLYYLTRLFDPLAAWTCPMTFLRLTSVAVVAKILTCAGWGCSQGARTHMGYMQETLSLYCHIQQHSTHAHGAYDTPNASSTAPLWVVALAFIIGFTLSPCQWMYANLTVGILSTISICTKGKIGGDNGVNTSLQYPSPEQYYYHSTVHIMTYLIYTAICSHHTV